MSARSLLMVALALILGGSAAVGVNSFMQGAPGPRGAVVPVVVAVVDLPRGEYHPRSGENQGVSQGARSGRRPVKGGGRGQSRYLRPSDQGRAGTGEQTRSQGSGAW